jgi:hypothetical protein
VAREGRVTSKSPTIPPLPSPPHHPPKVAGASTTALALLSSLPHPHTGPEHLHPLGPYWAGGRRVRTQPAPNPKLKTDEVFPADVHLAPPVSCHALCQDSGGLCPPRLRTPPHPALQADLASPLDHEEETGKEKREDRGSRLSPQGHISATRVRSGFRAGVPGRERCLG